MAQSWEEIYRRVQTIKPALKLLMKDRCIEKGSVILIPDGPLDIEIRTKDVRFYLHGELAGILDEKGLMIIIDEAKTEIENWCVALSSPGFKRYSIKKQKNSDR
ncbi:hypothetical protein [Geoglobus acetivorans]|uniref:Uncharacterized protein n=1 Tax=Geoglobus acetivorans TaxID=565033 RepID=A0A0A7GGV2_GEOAI|nr:hypothetical protein GACE_2259 [Geoglobus acetivorans]